MNLVREPDAVNPPVRFDEREVETEHGMRIMRHSRGNPDTELFRSLPHRATSRLYPEFCVAGILKFARRSKGPQNKGRLTTGSFLPTAY